MSEREKVLERVKAAAAAAVTEAVTVAAPKAAMITRMVDPIFLPLASSKRKRTSSSWYRRFLSFLYSNRALFYIVIEPSFKPSFI